MQNKIEMHGYLGTNDYLSSICRSVPKVAVLGDSIIDEYFSVTANRISPEFPIPVMESECIRPHRIMPGGAANVCYQCKSFTPSVHFFGILNEYAYEVFKDKMHVGSPVLANHLNCKIPIKKRFYEGDFPLCRMDEESKNYNLRESDFLDSYSNILSKLDSTFDVAIFSDYSKGFFKSFDVGSFFKKLPNALKIVDPKNGPLFKWKGCDIIKPNSKEAEAISGQKNWRSQASYFSKETDCQNVIITQGGEGVVGIIEGEFFEYRPDFDVKANSVVGAGDCFISVLAVCAANSIPMEKCVEIAFKAGAKYVTNKHNDPVWPTDLIESKLVDAALLADRNFKLCFTNGCFDIIHSGHLNTLRFAKEKGEKLVVGLNSDSSVSKQKKDHPLINSFEQRVDVLESLEFVDYIVAFSEETPKELIEKIKPDVLVKSEEYSKDPLYPPVGYDIAKETYFAPILENFSTSNIIKNIKNNNT